MQRHSKQNEVILKNLKNRFDHPTAEMIYASVREEIPNISLGTVYRNLRNLCEDNTISCFNLYGTEHFDANDTLHMHLCCLKCGKIEDHMIKDDFAENLPSELYDISNIIVHGTCSDCR